MTINNTIYLGQSTTYHNKMNKPAGVKRRHILGMVLHIWAYELQRRSCGVHIKQENFNLTAHKVPMRSHCSGPVPSCYGLKTPWCYLYWQCESEAVNVSGNDLTKGCWMYSWHVILVFWMCSVLCFASSMSRRSASAAAERGVQPSVSRGRART